MPRLVYASVPLLPVTLAMAAGILCGVSGWAVPLVVCSLTLAAVLMYSRRTYLAIILCAMTLGSVEAMLFIPGDGAAEFENVDGEFHAVVRDVKDTPSGQRELVDVHSYTVGGGQANSCRPTPVSVYIPGFTPEIRETDRIVFRGRIEPVRVSYDIPPAGQFRISSVPRNIPSYAPVARQYNQRHIYRWVEGIGTIYAP